MSPLHPDSFRPDFMKRLQKLHRQQPKAAPAELVVGEPVDLVVLATKTNGATCRPLGRDGRLTLRSGQRWDVVPGRILTLVPSRVWSTAGHTYVAGEQTGTRFDASALGLVPLHLQPWGPWDPMAWVADEPVDQLPEWAQSILAQGPLLEYEFESCLPGSEASDFDDPYQEAMDRWDARDKRGAEDLLNALCQADLRCLQAHAGLGHIWFKAFPKVALWHYEVGLGIGRLSLGSDFLGVLPWGCDDNRPFLRCMHGFGLCLWRLGRFEEAVGVFLEMLGLNPVDNQGLRFLLDSVRAHRSWDDFAAEEEGECR